MPTPFNISGGSSGGVHSTGGENSNSRASNHTSSSQTNFTVEIDREDPAKLFTDLTEIGHGNFGAVYYVN